MQVPGVSKDDFFYSYLPDPEDVHQYSCRVEDYLSIHPQHSWLLPLLVHLQMAKQTNVVKHLDLCCLPGMRKFTGFP